MRRILVVTGGIGSGKSVVCSMLEKQYGIPVYNADKRAKELYSEVPSLLEEIENMLHAELRNRSGEFLPSMLADIIFKSPSALRVVEEILFPVMKRDFLSWAEKQENTDVVAFESATVLEKKQFDDFGDIILLVDAPVDCRIRRAMERDGSDRSRILARMDSQPLMNRLSSGEDHSRIDYVLKNEGTIAELNSQLADFVIKNRLTNLL